MIQYEQTIRIFRPMPYHIDSPISDLSQLKRLVIFAHVVEQGSFAATAKLLQMNRSGVSEQVAQLEKHLANRLLHRTTRKLTLTTEGEKVYRYAKSIKTQYQDLLDSLQSDHIGGRIRLTTTHNFAVQWLNPRLKAFTDRYPAVQTDLLASDNEVDLIENNIDLAIRIGQLQDSSMVSRPLFRDPLIMYAAPSFLEKYGVPESVEALADYPWVLLEEASPKQLVTLKKDNKIHTLTPKHYHYCNSPIVAISQITCGMGIGLILPSRVEKAVQQGELVPILPDWHSGELTFSIMYSSRRQMPKRVRLLLDFLLS